MTVVEAVRAIANTASLADVLSRSFTGIHRASD